MFLLRSTTNQRQVHTLNAIAPPADTYAARHSRRLGLCQRLADLGMAYAEAAQREGLRDLQPPPERRPPIPGMYMPPSQPTYRDTALAETFATLSRCVRQAILLEARLDSETLDSLPALCTAPPAPSPQRSSDSPRAGDPGDGTRLDHERLEDDLAAEWRRTPSEILADIRQQLERSIKARHAPGKASPAAAAQTPDAKPTKPRHPLKPDGPPKQDGPPKPDGLQKPDGPPKKPPPEPG